MNHLSMSHNQKCHLATPAINAQLLNAPSHSSSINMSSLLIVDLQEDFFGPTRIAAKPFTSSLSRLLRQFTTRRRPIIWIASTYEQGEGASEEVTLSEDLYQSGYELYLAGTHRSGRFCAPNTPGIEIHRAIFPMLRQHHIRITKTYYSAFRYTRLHNCLQQTDTKHVFLAGVTTNTCIAATAVNARKLGYEVTIVEDCVKAFKQQAHDRAIITLTAEPYNSTICSSHDVSSEIDGDRQLRPLPVLYWVNGSIPSWRVMIALAWKNIPYKSQRLKIMTEPKETRNPDFALINPRCKTPTFVDSDGTIVIESMAILQYLERFYPGNPGDRPSDLLKAEWTQETVRFHESENPHNIYEPIELLYDADWERHRERILEAYHDTLKELEHWETYLANAEYLSARDTFGMADCAFYPILAYMVHRGLDLTLKYPSLRDYVTRCGALQAVGEACPDQWETPGKSLFLECEKMLKE